MPATASPGNGCCSLISYSSDDNKATGMCYKECTCYIPSCTFNECKITIATMLSKQRPCGLAIVRMCIIASLAVESCACAVQLMTLT